MARSAVTTLVLLCGAQYLTVLDVTIVAIALPDMRHSLGFSASGLQWVVSAYTLAFGGLLVAAGRLGDVAGRRRMFVAGLVGFGAASLACALAPSPEALIGARAVQGVAAALLTPAALALLTGAFPQPEERRGAVGWWTAAAAGGGASGWVLGGVLVELLGWSAVFLVNVPLCAAGAVAAQRVLAADDRRAAAGNDRGAAVAAGDDRGAAVAAGNDRGAAAPRGALWALDLPGAVAVTSGLSLLVLGLTRVEAAGPDDPAALGSLAAAIAALALFVRLERRAPSPILPPWTLRRPAFATASVVAVALTAATTPAMLLAILYQQDELGRGALETGLWCAPLNLSVIAGSLVAARAGRPPRAAMTAGLTSVAAGAAALIALSPAVLPLSFVLMGGGLGFAAVASTASGTSALGAGQQGVASGVLNAAAQVGTAVGLAVVVTLAAATGYAVGFAAAAAIAFGTAAATRRSIRRPRRRPTRQPRSRSRPAPSTGTR